jgi:hypothetical protein
VLNGPINLQSGRIVLHDFLLHADLLGDFFHDQSGSEKLPLVALSGKAGAFITTR